MGALPKKGRRWLHTTDSKPRRSTLLAFLAGNVCSILFNSWAPLSNFSRQVHRRECVCRCDCPSTPSCNDGKNHSSNIRYASSSDTLSAVPIPSIKEREEHGDDEARQSSRDGSNDGDARWPFTSTDVVAGMASGASLTGRSRLVNMLKIGIPLYEEYEEDIDNQDALILYSNDALPDGTDHSKPPMSMSPEEATKNCNYLNIAVIQRPERRQCLAIISSHSDATYHIQTYRRQKQTDEENPASPLLPVGKGVGADGHDMHPMPGRTDTEFHYKMLSTFIEMLDSVLSEVKALADRVVRNGAVIGIVSNKGYSDFLANFACLSKARKIDISHVLVFATDLETKRLAERLGMVAYYNKKLFGSFPTEQALHLGDSSSFKMIYSKLMCMRVLSLLGYDFLFQDVDVFWYRDPLEYFQAQDSDFDMYFMHDGSSWRFYAPYNANAGLFYARNNERTRNLFASLLHLGDNHFSMNDQALMSHLISEHTSSFGLRVKVSSRDKPDLLGGYHYLKRPDLMRQVQAGKMKPYTFHVHWTNSKEKREYLRQLGLWYVSSDGNTGGDATVGETITNFKLDNQTCACSLEPQFQCFYRNLPSRSPCFDSPAHEQWKNESFW